MTGTGLAGKVVIIFGATSGIGADTARYFGREGATVVLTGRRTELGEEVTRDIHDAGGSAVFMRTDIGVEDDVRATIDATVENFGRLDAIVNNAAPTEILARTDVPIARQTNEGFDAILRVSMWGLFYCCKHAIVAMLECGGGSIVNISSAASVTGIAGIPTYAMTKGAMNSLTRAIAVDYGKQNIRANTIIVGFVPTSEVAQVLENHPVAGPAFREITSLPRFGFGDDVAAAAAFFVSDSAAWVTGTLLPVDGGMTTHAALPDLTAAFAD